MSIETFLGYQNSGYDIVFMNAYLAKLPSDFVVCK
jgi:hypothetical protein